MFSLINRNKETNQKKLKGFRYVADVIISTLKFLNSASEDNLVTAAHFLYQIKWDQVLIDKNSL